MMRLQITEAVRLDRKVLTLILVAGPQPHEAKPRSRVSL